MKHCLLLLFLLCFMACSQKEDERFVTYTAAAKDIRFFWKDDRAKRFGNFLTLRDWVESNGGTLAFATNGGMYKPDHSPQGLYIENSKTLSPLDTLNGKGNFYLKPNGIFYITSDYTAGISTTENFNSSNVKYATQSGPMLVIDGSIHPAFKEGSPNVQLRNGVGILPGGEAIFAMSRKPVNFYDFAQYFKSLGCSNALYLDGFVSRTYLPEKGWVQADSDFGVIIGVVR